MLSDIILLGSVFQCNQKNNTYLDETISFIDNLNINGSTHLNKYVSITKAFLGLHAYVITNRMATILIHHFEKIDDVLDIKLSHFINENNNIKAYALNDYIVSQNLLLYESSINVSREPNIINSIFDKIYLEKNEKYKISVAYTLNINRFKIFWFKLNIINVLIIIFGFYCGFIFVNKNKSSKCLEYFVIFLIFDYLYSKMKNMKSNFQNYFIIISLYLIGLVSGLAIRSYLIKTKQIMSYYYD